MLSVELIAALFVLMVAFTIFVIALRYLKIWFQAYMAQASISMLDIVGMTFRRVDAQRVVRAIIIASQGGIRLSCQEVEAAYLRGADVEKIAMAMVAARRDFQQDEFTFQQLVDTDVDSTLVD